MCCPQKDMVIRQMTERIIAQAELLGKRAEFCQGCREKDQVILALADKLRICSEELGEKAERS